MAKLFKCEACVVSISSINVKLVLSLSLSPFQKREACFVFDSPVNVKFVLFSSFFQECCRSSSSHFPMIVHHLNRYKETPHSFGTNAHVKTFTRALHKPP
jgi:hypothetical protein